MTIKNGKITEATEAELFEHYLKFGFDDIMSFLDFKTRCVSLGTKIVDEDGENDDK